MITDFQKNQLRAYFSTQPVDAVYLFGSQITNKANKLSDLDIGVLFKENVIVSRRFDLRLDYMSEVGRITGFPDNVDVVDLTKAPPAFVYQAIFPKQLVFIGNEDKMMEMEKHTVKRYLDIRLALHAIAARQLQQIAEQGFTYDKRRSN